MDLISPSVGESSLRAAQPRSNFALPCRPEANARSFELARIEGENLVGWRELVHVSQVLFEKGEDLRPTKIIKLNPHAEPFVRPNDPSSATRPPGGVDYTRSEMAGFAAACG
jgi:hypothetical protein